MENIDIKAYTNRAKELEAAIYTQKKLIKEHEKVIKTQKPLEPTKPEVYKPEPPNINDYKVEHKTDGWGVFMTIMFLILGVEGLVFLIIGTETGFGTLMAFVGVLLGALGVALTVGWFKEKAKLKAKEQENQKLYERYKSIYPNMMQDYEKALAKAEEDYQEAQALYVEELSLYNQNGKTMMNKHNDLLSSLEEALQDLYAENVVFPKYRNLVAITTINEYLESGRCYELEGPNGAYNLYEMELRQNIVISQLSNIVSNLEQIRNNQYSLYEELTKSNQTVAEIVHELKDLNNTTKLNTYFNYVAAKAATAPRVTYGRIYS